MAETAIKAGAFPQSMRTYAHLEGGFHKGLNPWDLPYIYILCRIFCFMQTFLKNFEKGVCK
jgi:hypothetical protein